MANPVRAMWPPFSFSALAYPLLFLPALEGTLQYLGFFPGISWLVVISDSLISSCSMRFCTFYERDGAATWAWLGFSYLLPLRP